MSAAPLAAQPDRRARIDITHYNLQVEINPRTQSLKATAIVRLTPLDEAVSTLTFELHNALHVEKVVDGQGRQLIATRSPQDFSVRVNLQESLAKGKIETLVFNYGGRLTGNEESPVYGIRFASIQNDYAYLMYPARWFPTNGYTADTFAASLSVAVPDGYRVIASGLETKSSEPGRTAFNFEHQRPSFPGSIAVVQGEPARVSAEGVTTALYFRGESAAHARAYGEQTGKLVTLMTGHFGLPPVANLTMVQTEDGAPNGYSAPGIVFLSPRAIQENANARLLANQIARQWWGNFVAPATRDEIWIANSFARLGELLWLEQTSGEAAVDAELKDLYVEALAIDDVPILQAGRLEDYSPEYWAVTSAKGASVLAMLESVIGKEAFEKLLKTIPQEYGWKNTSTGEIRKLAEAVGQKDLRGFFIQWFESTGAPEFKLEYTVFRTANGFRVMGKISQDLDTFRMPVELRIETEGNPEFKTVEVVGTSSEFLVDTFGRPKRVTIDPNGKVLRYSNTMRVAVAIRRGEMFAEISDFAEALKEYQKALDVNRNSSLAHYRVGELFLQQRNYQSAANEFREALNGDLDPKWTEVWSYINLGKIFDITGQRERAVNEYNQAIRTRDNTQGAQEEAAKYLKTPYER
jgi:aminopeptidase N